MLENTLKKWGVTIIHKKNMHEKLIFIDGDILWSGSLNPLSFRDTQEVMERRVSKVVYDDFAKTLRLNELLKEYDTGEPSCPYCGSEVVASEGRDKPFYWSCIEKGCYTRDIDQPPLKGGVISCPKCGGKVEYGEWAEKPSWRCIENRHHHQQIVRAHILLPEMRSLIPKKEIRKLDKFFCINKPPQKA